MSKTLYVINETDTTLTSLLLDVEGKPLDKPIEVLSGPVKAGGVQKVVISLPEKQAKKEEWTVLAITEKGAEYSKPFTVSDMNPHGDNPVKGFYVKWFETESGGHYSVGVSFIPPEEIMQSQTESSPSPAEIPFEADESSVGDPPEGSLSVFEAQKQLAAVVVSVEEQALWETQGLFYIYRGIETDQDSTEFYRIDLCVKDESVDEYEVLRSYLASPEGAFYRQSAGGEWELIGSDALEKTPEQTDVSDAAWWGEYQSDTATLGISNYRGQSFRFKFQADDGAEFDGVAAVYEDNPFQAEYMDLVFELSKDTQMVMVMQIEDREDKAERSEFVGKYNRK